MQTRLINTVLTFIICLTSFISAFAAPANNAIVFKADRITYNFKDNATILIGNVTLNQATTQLTGDQVTIYKDTKGNVKQMIAVGKPATYNNTAPDPKKSVHAEGQTIEYYPNTHIAILINKASITQAANTIKGPYITYNTETQTIQAKRDKAKQQAQIIIEPQDNDAKPSKKSANKP